LRGVDEDHQQLEVDLLAPSNVHAAVLGMTGSGKSTLMRTMILSALKAGGARVALFDPSNGFRPLSGHPAVWRGGLFRRAEDCELGLELLARSLGKNDYGLLYVFVDEVPELVMQRPKIKDYLSRLAQAGRHAGIHLILGAQHPLASTLGPMTMRNVPVRLVGRVADRSAAYNATGRSDSGAEYLRGGGDFLVVNGATLRHFQAAIITDKLLRAWAERYPPREPRLPVRPTPVRERDLRVDMIAAIGEPGQPGRPLDDIPDTVIRQIQHYMRSQGRLPSSNWVYRLTRELVPTGGFNRAKAQRAIDVARQGLGSWMAQETSLDNAALVIESGKRGD